MRLPTKRKTPRMGLREPYLLECPGHLRMIRAMTCSVENHECTGRIEPHHVKEGHPGMGATNHDFMVVPLCSYHHARGESPNWSWRKFEAHYGVDLSEIAAALWRMSPARKHMEAKRRRERGE